jgi:Collagen triple helix repeat (20 copies)
MKGLRHPATAVSVLALFVALGGTAYASGLIRGSQIKNHTIAEAKLTKKAVKALRGQRGPRGPVGATGASGPTGHQGPQGLQGLPGTPGMSDYTVVTSTESADANFIGATVPCPSGTKALGGGSEVLSGTSDFGPFLTDSLPADGGWLVDYSMSVSGNFSLSVEVYAICAKVSS